MAFEHLGAGVRAEVGLEDVATLAQVGIDLGDAGERARHLAQRRDLGFVEAAGAPRGERRRVHLAVQERERQSEEIGDAFLAKVFQHREIDRAMPFAEAAPHLAVLGEDGADRTLQVLVRLQKVISGFVHLHLVGGLMPDEAASEDIGVERAHEHRRAVERQRMRAQSPRQLIAGEEKKLQLEQHILRQPRGRRTGDQPVDDRPDVQCLRSQKLDSCAPAASGSRESTPFSLWRRAWWLENSSAKPSFSRLFTARCSLYRRQAHSAG